MLLLSGKPVDPADLVSPMAALHSAFAAVMQETGQKVYALGTYRRNQKFRGAVGPVIDFVRDHIRPRNRLEEQSILKYLIRLLVQDLAARRKPTDQSYASACLRSIPSIVEQQFPGYREAGLLPQIIRRAI